MSDYDSIPLREDLRGVSAYGAPQIDVPTRLNTNENPHPPPDEVVKAITVAVGEVAASLQRYPDRDATELRKDLADYVTASTGVGVTQDQVWAANGSNEILAQLLQAFGGPGRVALGFEPSYSMHRIIARTTGTGYVAAPRNDDFTLSAVKVVEAVREHKPHVVFVCSPNNPTGTSTDLDVIAALYEASDGIVVVDEAYGEFSNQPSAVTLLARRPRLVVTRTMSKAFAFAGARVGYLVADPRIVDAMLLVRLPYHLSSITQAAARVALAHSDQLMAAVADLKVTRDRIISRCLELGCSVVPSDANFVLVGGFDDQQQVWQQLLAHGVLVRDVGLPGWLRVTAGTETQTDAFLAALSDILGQPQWAATIETLDN